MKKLVIRFFFLCTLVLSVNSIGCGSFTCERKSTSEFTLEQVESPLQIAYLAGLRRVGDREPFCFGVFIKDFYILTSSFCDEEINGIEGIRVPIESRSYDYIGRSKITAKKRGNELMTYKISNRLSSTNAYFKYKSTSLIWQEMIEMSKSGTYVRILGYGSYRFDSKEKEMPSLKNLLYNRDYQLRSSVSPAKITLESCCPNSDYDADVLNGWKNQKIFLLKSFFSNHRCLAETGGPVIINGYVYGIIRGHHKCSKDDMKAQILVSSLMDDIATSNLPDNQQDLHPPTLDSDYGDSGAGGGISDNKDPEKRNQTLKELENYGEEYYYGKASIMDHSIVVYFVLIKLI